MYEIWRLKSIDYQLSIPVTYKSLLMNQQINHSCLFPAETRGQTRKIKNKQPIAYDAQLAAHDLPSALGRIDLVFGL